LAVVSQENLILQRKAWKRNRLSVVCAAGAFDLLHPGHVRLLEQARALGDRLVVVVLSDKRVRQVCEHAKAGSSSGRPVNPENERAEVVAALSAVDLVAVVGWELTIFLSELKPDVYALGVAKPDRPVPVADPVDPSWPTNSKIAQIPLEPGYSTALLIEKIQQPYA
jgi:rfaE bifunctional protein nucleotidyltransferase chain/domain